MRFDIQNSVNVTHIYEKDVFDILQELQAVGRTCCSWTLDLPSSPSCSCPSYTTVRATSWSSRRIVRMQRKVSSFARRKEQQMSFPSGPIYTHHQDQNPEVSLRHHRKMCCVSTAPKNILGIISQLSSESVLQLLCTGKKQKCIEPDFGRPSRLHPTYQFCTPAKEIKRICGETLRVCEGPVHDQPLAFSTLSRFDWQPILLFNRDFIGRLDGIHDQTIHLDSPETCAEARTQRKNIHRKTSKQYKLDSAAGGVCLNQCDSGWVAMEGERSLQEPLWWALTLCSLDLLW